ncbi:YitT family protein, partial [Ligilactobacillus sp.]|uniref:YitT family protein n=1 Tax=Ligilactobacillus sp. TaxID=2767921 RepID=UPI002FE03F0C
MKKTIVVNLMLNTVGAFLYTVAINGFLISNHLGEGGVTGLMTIFYYWLKIAPSLTNI